MFNVLRASASIGLLTVIVMHGFGLDPKKWRGELVPQVVYIAALALVLLGMFGTLVEMVFVKGRKVDAKGIDAGAAPIREFDYRWRRLQSALMFAVAGVFAAPLLVGWPLMLAAGVKDAREPMIPSFFAFLFLMAVVTLVMARRGWAMRVLVYADRLAVRGLYSNGSLRWDEATAFRHVEEAAGEWNTMWVYHLDGAARSLRVECTVESPEEFVREVESRTGLTLEKQPVGGEPEPKPAKRAHEAFSRC